MTEVRSHYENLMVARNAPPEVIRAAYKALAQKYHPDRNFSDPEAGRVMAMFNEAYRVLSDPILRKQHDDWIDETESNEYRKEKAATSADASTDHGPINNRHFSPPESLRGEAYDLEPAYKRFIRDLPILALIVGLIVLLLSIGVSSR